MKVILNYKALSYALIISILLVSFLGLAVFSTQAIYIDNTGYLKQFANTLATISDTNIVFITRQQIIFLFLTFQFLFTAIFYYLFCHILKKSNID